MLARRLGWTAALLLSSCRGGCVEDRSSTAQLMCVVHADEPPVHTESGTIADRPEPEAAHGQHTHARVLAVPLNEIANRCTHRGQLRVVINTPPGSGTVRASLEVAGRKIEAQALRGAAIAIPGAVLLDGLPAGTYAPVVLIDGRRIRVPEIHVPAD
jgi:hypothetical protein